MKLVKGRIVLASTAGLILTLASVHLLAPARVRAQSPTPTPALSYQSNVSPPSGTYVDPTAVPAPSFTYSLVISNMGQTAATPLVVRFDSVDLNLSTFTSTLGACTWIYGPDYHGHGYGQCDLGSLPPSEGSPSTAAINIAGDIFWNFYSHNGAQGYVTVNNTPIAQGFDYPFGTPTPISGTSASVGGIVEMPNMDGSDSSGRNAPLIGGVGLGVGALALAAVWLARKRRPASR